MYLDNSATSFPKPECVYTAVNDFMRNNGANAGRGNYALARDAEELIYQTRKSAAKLLGAKKASNIVFTGNVTEALNMILKGFLNDGDEVLTSSIEHNAMWRPLNYLQRDKNVKIHTFSCAKDGSADLQEIKDLLGKNIKLVALVHGSNVLGSIFPLQEIVEPAHEKNIPVLVDAAQTAGAIPINIEALGVDFLAFTGHKGLLGPTGTGGFYIKEGLELRPLKAGGTGSVSTSPFQPDSVPDRYEAGTMNTMGLAGLKAGTEFLLQTGVNKIHEHEIALVSRLLNGLANIGEVEVYGPQSAENRLGLATFNIRSRNPYDVSAWLDEHAGIMVRAGLHCSPQAHRVLGTVETGAVRASVGYFNTAEDIDALLQALRDYIKIVRK
ncbi:MAG TPA: aminotransferase class V-fold PLP-dependent enzyme [Oscillospiraceae bacterium]|nr:aminotransferase class V-fold PLP-dependent enzyme [Oscillospiraceae bacterium]HPS34782.1 aminotransferase class V-fold PLP-dependent enzyme [Oscillospiraceae bacterium]